MVLLSALQGFLDMTTLFDKSDLISGGGGGQKNIKKGEYLMANTPQGLLNKGRCARLVNELREYVPPEPARCYQALRDKNGDILRDKAGNPIIEKRLN